MKKIADDIFTIDVIKLISNEIKSSYNNEVLFFGWIDEDGKIFKCEVIARGNEECVSFPIDRSYLPDVVIHNHPNGNLTPSEADMSIANFIAQHGVGFVIVNSDLSKLYVAVEPVKRKKFEAIDPGKCTVYLSKDNGVENIIENFEERSGQKQMIKDVCSSFNEDKIALIEAGTGIGKSFAYLIPAIEWSIKNKERVVISTKTINLQEQLLKKDIPTVKKILGKDFEYTLMKGRGNYICLNRIMEVAQDLFSFIDDEEQEQFDKILSWVRKTNDGSISDLPFNPLPSLWEKINSKTETCMGAKCKYFSECFVNEVRREALRSHIVITNHHYFLADSSLSDTGASVLPNYSRVIFDEAHRLEDSATSFFTKTINEYGFMTLLNQLHRYKRGKTEKGYISYLKKKNLVKDISDYKKIVEVIEMVKKNTASLFKSLGNFINDFFQNNQRNTNIQRDNYQIIEINEEVRNYHGWDSEVLLKINKFYKSVSSMENQLLELRKLLDEKKSDVEARQIEGYITRFMDILQIIDIFLKDEDDDYVRWIDGNKKPIMVISLIEVGKKLEEMVYDKVKTLIMTSATLTVNNKFHFIKNRLGINRETYNAKIDSPFDFNKQMAIMIPEDMVEPKHPSYTQGLSFAIENLIRETGGNTLILFTSYRTLNDVYKDIFFEVSGDGFVLLKQGDRPRQQLLNEFKLQRNTILFGTESFWEGVDVPGENLQCVIITKLPFKVPTDPVIRARLKRIELAGKNPFMNYLLPLAVIKTKQGVGRLIRRKSDRGIIMILDRRIITKNYGDIFLKSLPDASLHVSKLKNLLPLIQNYVNKKSLTK